MSSSLLSPSPDVTTPGAAHHRPWLAYSLLGFLAIPVIAIMIWQGLTTGGNPDPTAPNVGRGSAILDIAVLVFREGLESILVLAAITAGLVRKSEKQAAPIFLGATAGFVATLATWVAVRGLVYAIGTQVSYLALQAGTGLVAVIVLLVVMNWFFHKVYWVGWISVHNRQKKKILESSETNTRPGLVYWSLVLLGLTSVYREGFEIVLFLQGYYLKLGGWPVFYGSLIGLVLTAIVATITFIAHQRMPYRKMLIITGVMLGFVLLVMVGEQAYEMQQANWISTTTIHALENVIPAWAGVWFSIFPTVETIVAQVIAAVLVLGSYFFAGRMLGSHPALPEQEQAKS